MQEKIYTKYKLTTTIPKEAMDDERKKLITIYAKVSDKGISIRDQYDREDFEFTCSKKEEVQAVAELIIEATNINEYDI